VSLDIQRFRIISSIQRGDQRAVQEAIDGFGTTARESKSIYLAWHHQRLGIVQRMNLGELNGVSEALSKLRERAEGFGLDTGLMLSNLDFAKLLSLTSGLQPFKDAARARLLFDDSDTQNIWASKIRSLVDLGLITEAETALKRYPVAMICELPLDLYYLATLAHLAVGSIAAQAMEYVDAIYQLLKPYPQYFVAGFSFHCEGSVSYFLGLLARSLGRNTDAIAHFEEAIEQNTQFNLKAQVVRSRCELARSLTDNATQKITSRARSLLKQTLEDARKLGMQKLYEDAERLLKT
jgi:tetratricopeptide (TPR) repeat protein